MKLLYEWIKDNISTLFTFLGIFLTIYFSIFYIPRYVKEMQDEKIKNVNESLIESIQELVYNSEALEYSSIANMIEGKELRYKISYPYTIEELLTLTQERFIENKFIPLKERKKLVDKLETIKSKPGKNIKQVDNKDSQILNFRFPNITSILLSLLGVGVALLGTVSTLFKLKREKEEKIEADVQGREEEIQNTVMRGFAYEKLIEEALKELKLDYQVSSGSPDHGYDFVFTNEKFLYLIEAKYYSKGKRIPINVIHRILGMSMQANANIVLITNGDLTKPAMNAIDEFNQKYSEKSFYFIKGETKGEIVSELNRIITGN